MIGQSLTRDCSLEQGSHVGFSVGKYVCASLASDLFITTKAAQISTIVDLSFYNQVIAAAVLSHLINQFKVSC